MEDFVYILDYLPAGLPEQKRYKREPVAYGIGDSEFKLLELIPKPEVVLQIGERVYIGKEMEKREKIAHVKGRIGYTELTSAAQKELIFALIEIVKNNEERFIKFYNEAAPITTRLHTLELLPGLGKKTLWTILNERKKGPFASFKEMSERVSGIGHPERIFAKRIEVEISDPTQKYHIFVSKWKKSDEF